MRIVHISDIHLSQDNFAEFENNYLDALLQVLSDENKKLAIDLIVITGDLIDQGGHSLFDIKKFEGRDDPYEIFEEEFIVPIKHLLAFDNSRFLFIPGNHDVDEKGILWTDEKKLKKDIDAKTVEKYLSDGAFSFNSSNLRIEKFKNFEERFHKENDDYKFTKFQSSVSYTTELGLKVGIALINDSWRCSTCRIEGEEKVNLFFGAAQLYASLSYLKSQNTSFNIILTHHSMENYVEKSEFKKIIINKDYHLHLFGHSHKQEYDHYLIPNKSCLGLMARSGLNKPKEIDDEWKPGFQIIDIDEFNSSINRITFYLYREKRCEFVLDTHVAGSSGTDEMIHQLGFPPLKLENTSNIADLNKAQFYQP